MAVRVVIAFLVAVTAAGLGVVAMVRLATGRPVLPTGSRDRLEGWAGSRAGAWRHGALSVGVGLGLVLLTRWPLAGLAGGVVVFVSPRLFGGAAAGRRQLAVIEAIAAWTESLRDTATAAAGLEQAIPATLPAAQPLLLAPLRELAARLDGRVPLPEALVRFADDVNDPAADLVVAALSLNARQRAGGLDRVLTSLAASSRAELEMRRKVELERRSIRRQSQQIAGAVLGFAVAQAVFARGWLSPYGSLAGQVALGVLIALFLVAFARMRALAATVSEPRFLTTPDQVTEIASYQPHTTGTRGRP